MNVKNSQKIETQSRIYRVEKSLQRILEGTFISNVNKKIASSTNQYKSFKTQDTRVFFIYSLKYHGVERKSRPVTNIKKVERSFSGPSRKLVFCARRPQKRPDDVRKYQTMKSPGRKNVQARGIPFLLPPLSSQ